MPRDEQNSTSEYTPIPVAAMKQKLLELQKAYNINKSKMAEISGMERTAWHRLLKSEKPLSLRTLHRFSQYFNRPISFWFADVEGEPLEVPSFSKKCLCERRAPLTEIAIEKIAALSAVKKKTLIDFLESESSLETALELATILAVCDNEKAGKLVRAMRIIAAEKQQQAVQ